MFLTGAAGVFLAPAVHAGGISGPPQWYPFEMNAINLYRVGINQESSGPQGALTTLRQARQDSTEAIAHGGGTDPAVSHNDQLIAQALMAAQTRAGAAKTSDTVQAAQKLKSSKAVGKHSQIAMKLR